MEWMGKDSVKPDLPAVMSRRMLLDDEAKAVKNVS
jgi:hypothetical protein